MDEIVEEGAMVDGDREVGVGRERASEGETRVEPEAGV